MDKKRMQDGAHSFAFRQVHNDTSRAAILSKIAQTTRAQSVRISKIVTRLGSGCRTKVSNSDQLFFWAWEIMLSETSTSSLSFRSLS
jgi:hypothetical protein